MWYFPPSECNYAKGKWVRDKNRPLYSGFECKAWLSEMWACRLTERTDFSYEGFKWQPDSCNMPDFKPSTFLKRRDYLYFVISPNLIFYVLHVLCACVQNEEQNYCFDWRFVREAAVSVSDVYAYCQ